MNKYPSLFSPGKQVTAAQYITELVCDRYARQNETDLPDKFWELPYWKGYYQYQVVMAHSLIRKYGASTVVKAMSHKDAAHIISFKQKKFQTICAEVQASTIEVQPTEVQKRIYDNRGTQRQNKSKLDALDE